MKRWELPKFKKIELRKRKTRHCVCIPVKDEGEKIIMQLKRMKPYMKYADVVIADWGSNDGSTKPSLLKKLGVKTLLTLKSPGRQATQLRMAFSYAIKEGYFGVIQIDGNNKDGVSAIPRFIKALDGGYDYVQGSRFMKGGKHVNTPLQRYIGIRFVTSPILSLAARFWYTDITNGFRAYSRKYLLHPMVKPFRNIFERYVLNFYLCVRANQLGLKTKEIPVTRIYPKGNIPTKMHGIKGQLGLLEEVLKTALGHYHPQN